MVLGKIFGGNRKAEARAEEADAKIEAFELYPPRTPKGLNPKDIGVFGKKLAAFRLTHMELDDARHKGSLQILDLETVALRFGKRWLNIREKAFRHIESCVAKRLGANDLYVCESESRVLLLMTDIDRSDAELRGMRIGSEITERLCGVIPGGVAVRFKTLVFDFASGLDGVTGLTALQDRIKAFNKTADSAEISLFQEIQDDLRMHYHPTFDVNSGRIFIYHGCPKVQESNGDLMPTDVVCPHSVNGVFYAEIDKWCLDKSKDYFTPNASFGSAPMLVVPLRFETLCSRKHRDDYIAICRQLPEYSADQLVFEIIDLPASVPQARIRELLAYVKPFCNHLIARISHNVLFAENLTSCGVATLSLQLNEVDEADPATEILLRDFKKLTSSLGMRALLTDTWSVKLCQMAVKAGIDQFNGTAFMEATQKPGSVIETRGKEAEDDTD